MLIKNMFTNKDQGWKASKELNEGGPEKKESVAKKIQDKINKDNAAKYED